MKRRFLVPVAATLAALLGVLESEAHTQNEKDSLDQNISSQFTAQMDTLGLDGDFVITRSLEAAPQTAFHRSHSSHYSHRSHSSHYSHRSHYSGY